jgi:serine phosphatase RsbU (regulator of sigma subunit)
VAWRNARQTERLIAAREQERELQIAKDIQLGLLPAKVPQLTGIALAGACVPAHQVGGDYYDYLQRGDKLLDLVIADVSGHNVGAALLMAETRTFIQARSQGIHRASDIMSALNEFFYEDLTRAELFITMFYLIYDADSRRLSFASAGHNPPFVWRTGSRSCERLDAEGLILGIRRRVDFEEKQVQLYPGDVLLLYTDGITEAENQDSEFFGEERLAALFAEYHHQAPQQIIDNLLQQVRLFTGVHHFNDDVSLVVMQVAEGESEVVG